MTERDIHHMLTKCLRELDDVVQRLSAISDLLIDVRNRNSGVGKNWRDGSRSDDD